MARMARQTPEDRARMKTWKAYGEALERIRKAGLPEGGEATESFDMIAERVIFACTGMGWGAWVELDERSGYRELPGLFHWVRQTRNSPKFGRDLIRAVNMKTAGRTFSG